MDAPTRILIVEDLPSDAGLAEREIKKAMKPCVFECVDTRPAFLRALSEFKPDIVVTDYRMPQFDGMTALKLSVERAPLIPVIILTSAINEDTAVECMKAGAADYVIKEHIKRLGQAVVRALEEKQVKIARIKAEHELQQSEEQYRRFFEDDLSGVYLSTPDGRILACNPAFIRIMGYGSAVEILQASAFDLYRERGERDAFLAKLRRQRKIVNEETELVRKDGKSVHVIENVIGVFDERDELVECRGYVFDVTERRRAEERQAAILQSVPLVLYAAQTPSRFDATWMSENVQRITGFPSGTFVQQEEFWSSRVHPHDSERVETTFAGIGSGQGMEVEYRWKCADGSYRWFLDRATSVHQTTDGKSEYSGIWLDITERKRAEEALGQSQEKYRTLIENVGEGIGFVDPAEQFVFANHAAEEIFGVLPGSLSGRNLREFLVPERVAEIHDQTRRRRAGEKSAYEIEIKRPDGTKGDLLVTAVPQFDSQGEFAGTFGVFRDITERKRAEEALRASDSRTREIVDNAPFGAHLYELEPERGLVFVGANRAADSILGVNNGQFVGKTIEEAFPPLRQTDIPDAYRRVATTGERYDVDQVDYADGSIRGAFEVHAFQTGPDRMATFFRDITERKRAEEALRESEERYRTLAQTLPDAVAVMNRTGMITYSSPAALKLFGNDSESDVLGKSVMLWVDVAHHGKALADIQRVIRGERIANEEYLFLKSDRSKFFGEVNASRMIDNAGSVAGIILVIRDISERKSLETQFLQAQKMEAVGRLAGGVAHDFNNMIGVILGYAKLIEDHLNPLDPLRRHAQAIYQAGERSANLTRQLLAFARKQVIAPVPLNLNESLSQLQRMLARLIGEDLTLTILPGENLWNITIDPTQVDQILANLATNARDAIDDIGTITIETTNTTIDKPFLNERPDFSPGDYVLLTFSDTGKGMDRATQERIFEPFFTTKPEGKGTGLGLATVFGIVKQNNGLIDVCSEPGNGTAFKIYFPRFHGKAEAPVGNPEEAALEGNETILIVEDEEQLLELSCSALEMYGYTVLSANSPGEAIILCEKTEKRIDLVITDVVMPGMNGKELRERLDALKPGMKTVFISGYTADIVAHRGILEKGVNFLPKPFTPTMLAGKVREVLDKKS